MCRWPIPLVPPVTIATRDMLFSLQVNPSPLPGLGSGPGTGKEKPRLGGVLRTAPACCSEAELGADVDGLAVLLGRIGQRGEAVAFLLIAHAGGDIEIAGQAIAAADIDQLRAGVRYEQERDRLAPLADPAKQDSQAVYVGTQFRF